MFNLVEIVASAQAKFGGDTEVDMFVGSTYIEISFKVFVQGTGTCGQAIKFQYSELNSLRCPELIIRDRIGYTMYLLEKFISNI